MTDEEIPPGGTEVRGPGWDPWRPEEVARRLAGVSVPWYAAAGSLRRALARVHPGHAWISVLDRPCPSR